MAAGAIPAVASPAQPAPGTAAPDVERDSLDRLLAQATDPGQAAALGARLEALRQQRLAPTILLLLNRAGREAAGGRSRDARADMDDAIALQPEQGLLWRDRAAIRMQQGDADGAVLDLGGALGRDPTDPLSWSALSRIEQAQGHAAQAFEAWERVLRLDPAIEGGAARLRTLHNALAGAPS